jgi:hypothetical protein
MKMREQTREAAQVNDEQQGAKKRYHRPQVTELGDIRELTRGGGRTTVDGKGSRGKAAG